MNTPQKNHPQKTAPMVLFAYGFRPFFIMAAIWSAGTMIAWLMILDQSLQALLMMIDHSSRQLQTFFSPIVWHAHEMLFGFVAASAAGFLLTASPNWSKKPALSGQPLMVLVALWIVGRLAN